MSRLGDHVAEPEQPTGPRLQVDASPSGGEFTGLVSPVPIRPEEYEGAFARVYELAGLDPSRYRIAGDTVKFSAWQQSARAANGDRDMVTLYAYRARFERISDADIEVEDMASLMAIARSNAINRPISRRGVPARTRIVVISDAQIGKVGSRGGTPALLDRLTDLMDQLDTVMSSDQCQDAVVIDPGDLCEGFENVAQQQFTNDLSHPAQLRVARAVLTDVVTRVASGHEGTTVVTVPSNHTAWRRGKDILGKPSDDYGVDTHMAVGEALRRDPDFQDVSWVFPKEWDESVALPVRGAVVGVAHGHQTNKADSIPNWWKAQAHGGQALTNASILVTGHYHNWRMQPTGSINGRSRWWFQAPTMDNGSDWFRNIAGEDAEPGIFTFTIDDAGAWGDLRLITPRMRT